MASTAVATYLTALPNDFVGDASELIQSNHGLIQSREWLAWFARTYTWGSAGTDETLYRPLTVLSYVVTARLGGASPLPFMVGNVLLHAAASLLVLALGQRLVGRAVGLLGALLFAIHPLHTEAVAWIAGRPDVLMTLFSVSSALCFVRATEAGALRPALWAGGTLVTYFAALLSKEHAVVLPAWFVVAWLIGRRRCSARWAAVIVIGSVVALGAFLAIRAGLVQPLYVKGQRAPHLGAPWTPWRWLTALAIAGHYAGLFLWPRALNFDNWTFGMVAVQSGRGLGLAELGGATVILGLGAAVLWSARRAPGLAQALALSGVTYSVVSMFPPSPFLFVAERVTYLPSVGVCIGAGWLLAGLGRWAIGRAAIGRAPDSQIPNGLGEAIRLTIASAGWRGWATLGLGVSLLVALSVRTAVRNLDWRTTESIGLASLAVNPDGPRALTGAGVLAFRRGNYAQAQTLLERSLRLNPTSWTTHVWLFEVYSRTGQTDKALELFSEGVRTLPDRPEPYHHLGGLLWRAGRLAEAEARFREATERHPGFLVSHLALGGVLLDEGRPADAAKAFEEATRLAPDNPRGWLGLARATQALGRVAEAESYAARARQATGP